MLQQPSKARLDGRRIVIAGGGSGIGRETALLFAKEGARVAVLDRAQNAAKAVAEECGGCGLMVDVADDASVRAAVTAAESALGGLDGLVNTAGIFDASRLTETEPESWSRIISINLTGTYLLCRHTLPILCKTQGATIVTMGSGIALVPPGPGSAAYVASKGGVIALSREIAAEAAPEVRVNCVCPGMVDTPMTKQVLRDRAGQVRSEITGKYALNRAAQPSEIALAILFLTSAESSFITGTTLAVDGGRTYH